MAALSAAEASPRTLQGEEEPALGCREGWRKGGNRLSCFLASRQGLSYFLSSVAFILSDTQDLLMTGEEQFSKRIQKFINIHRNSFLVLSAALHGPEEWNVMFRIQRRFLGSNLRIIPVHNTAETVKLMLTIAKITSKPQADDIRYKMAMTKAQIIENSPVWKMLQEYRLHCN
ncbi:protein SPO16 homolog isoform X1 [Tyto alba]|uniref:protein SPO16 homolog isoform X1 n=1 Tax=Tyto alba TaxID=56313 RepID=UPI001C66840F|nr:protein SPO16 homolog isoform X1 [Tyto alba]